MYLDDDWVMPCGWDGLPSCSEDSDFTLDDRDAIMSCSAGSEQDDENKLDKEPIFDPRTQDDVIRLGQQERHVCKIWSEFDNSDGKATHDYGTAQVQVLPGGKVMVHTAAHCLEKPGFKRVSTYYLSLHNFYVSESRSMLYIVF